MAHADDDVSTTRQEPLGSGAFVLRVHDSLDEAPEPVPHQADRRRSQESLAKRCLNDPRERAARIRRGTARAKRGLGSEHPDQGINYAFGHIAAPPEAREPRTRVSDRLVRLL